MDIDKNIIKQIKRQLSILNKNIVQYNRKFHTKYNKITIDMLLKYGLVEKFFISYKNNYINSTSFRKIRIHKGYLINNIFAGTKEELVSYLKNQKTKECSDCKKILDKGQYNSDSSMYDNLETCCKICSSNKKKQYYRSLIGRIKSIYKDQVNNSKKRNRPDPEYSVNWFTNWCISQPKYKILYENWVKSGYSNELSPSVDRIDSNKPYLKDNIQLMTWYENNLKGRIENSLKRKNMNNDTKYLIIVESPSKAKTLTKFLPSEYTILASYGHIADLPKNELGFDPEDNFKPKYRVTPDKQQVVKKLKSIIGDDTIVYLASDDDREGTVIATHLKDMLKLQDNQYKRIIFHEVTKDAIMYAINNPVKLDINLADAGIARRILDRAVGYKLSPLLWKKIKFGLSAGRTQSVAVRIIVDREQEINAFVPEEFWKIKAEFINPDLKADLVKIDGKNIKINNQNEARHIETSLKMGKYQLVDIEEKESIRNPAPPFTTSTLQQEASRKIGSSVKQTMLTAQQLYEGNVNNIPGHTGGLITYMRTDAVNLSTLATSMAKKVIEQEYGKEYSLETPRKFTTKAKGAQEAHEAIRPVNLALKPSDIKPYVDNYQFKLYELIWKRTLATQMTPAKVANTIYKIEAGKNKECEFQTKGQRIIFPGFMKAYTEGSDNPESALDSADKILPNIDKGTFLNIDKLLLEQNYTKPPARYTEASLVGKLEKEGIGRPSTYASTISTIITRGYVIIDDDKKLVPTPTGEVVVQFLKDQFPYIVDLKFTANIEEKFDDIAVGKIGWKEVIRDFYTTMKKDIVEKETSISKETYLQVRELGIDPVSGKPVSVRNGRFGQFIQIGTKEDEDKPRFANLPSHLSMNKITLEEALPLFALPRIVGKNKDGKDIKANVGKFGPYLQVEKSYYPLRDKDPYTVDLETALQVIKDTEEWRKNNPPKDKPKGKWKKSFKKK